MLQRRKTTLGADLAGAGLSDVINSEYADVSIIKRFPESGMPPKGIPFSVEIEVQTYRAASHFRLPFSCLDAFVVARGLYQYNNKILGSAFVRTDALNGCRGTATVQFDSEFSPGPEDWVRFELYPGGTTEFFSGKTTLQKVQNGDVEPIAVSKEMRFNASEKQLKEAGLVRTETASVFNLQNSLFKNLQGTVASVSVLLAVGTGSYLIWKNSDIIKQGIKNLTNR